MIVFPNAKINLGLHVLDKRDDGFHNLETIFYPVALHDALEVIHLQKPTSENVELHLSGLHVKDSPSDNICIKAYKLLKQDFDELPPVQMHLHKAIPIGAGLGGGSADAAFTLMLLNKKFNLQLTKEQLIAYATQLGSDCPFFIINSPCHATGRGEVLQEIRLDLSSYKIVLVHPGIHINTGWAFTQVQSRNETKSLKSVIQVPVEQWKQELKNDFEEVIFRNYPQVKQIKDELYQAGAVYASMSGSGSAVYGFFRNDLPSFSFPDNYFVKVM